jgi:hypothetical protein
MLETLEEHFEIMNLEVDIPEDYVGPLTGMDFANYADSRTNVHNVERNIQCSSASQANIKEITTQINQTKNNCIHEMAPLFYLEKFLLQVFSPQFSGNSLADFKFGDALKCLKFEKIMQF